MYIIKTNSAQVHCAVSKSRHICTAEQFKQPSTTIISSWWLSQK